MTDTQPAREDAPDEVEGQREVETSSRRHDVEPDEAERLRPARRPDVGLDHRARDRDLRQAALP